MYDSLFLKTFRLFSVGLNHKYIEAMTLAVPGRVDE